MLEPTDQPPANESTPPPPNRVQALLGIVGALAVVAGLGLPFLDVGATYQILLVVIGFRIARVTHRCVSEDGWRVPMVVGLAGRAVPAVALMVALVALYRIATAGLGDGEALALIGALTFTANVVPFVTGASFGAVDHMWAIALVAMMTVAAPWLLTVKRQQFPPHNRGMALFGLAAVLTLARMVAVASSQASLPDTAAWLAPPNPSLAGALAVWTSLDALLVGLAIGTLPLATLHRHPTTRLVVPALIGLALVVLAPSVGPPVIDIGLRLPLATLLMAVVLSAEAISSLPARLSSALTSAWWHRMGSRIFGLFLWHLPFAFGVGGPNPFEWQGPAVFVVALVLTLAAATTSYRSIELPAQMLVARIASRWFQPAALLPPQAEPQLGKWVRWDDISLDGLPTPHRRRARRRGSEPATGEPVGHRLWQLGDRAIDLRPGRRSAPEVDLTAVEATPVGDPSSTTNPVAGEVNEDTGHVGPAAAAG